MTIKPSIFSVKETFTKELLLLLTKKLKALFVYCEVDPLCEIENFLLGINVV